VRYFDEVFAVVVDGMIHTDLPQEIVLARARCPVHIGTSGFRDLHCRVPDTSSRRVNEYSLTLVKECRVDESLKRRERHERQSSRLHEVELSRLWRDASRGSDDELSV